MTAKTRENILIAVFIFMIVSVVIETINMPNLYRILQSIGIICVAISGIIDRKNMILPFKECVAEKQKGSMLSTILGCIGVVIIIISFIIRWWF